MEIIDIDKKILSGKKEIEVTNEFIVPDVKGDVVSIVSSSGIAYSYKEEISKGTFSLNGNIDVIINYFSADGDNSSVQNFLKFDFKVEENEIKEDSFSKYNIEIKEINPKILNERKILITVKLIVKYEIHEKQEISFYDDFENIEYLQKQEEILKLNSIIGINTAKTSIDEKIGTDLDKVKEILKNDISISNIEYKISYNKILAKAEANISMIYLTEDERISSVSQAFPVMAFVEIPDIKEENTCSLDFKIRNVLFKINNGDENYIETQIDFEILVEAFEEKNINIITDLYSLKNDLEYIKDDIEIEVPNNIGEEAKISEKVEIDNVNKIFDLDINFSKSNSLEANIKIYYETNEKNGLNVKEIKVPVAVKIDENKDYDFNIKSKEFSLEGNLAIIEVNFELKEEQSKFKTISVIKDVKVIENTEKEDYSVIIYFVKPNDTIWKIAKKFKISQNTLIKINNLEDTSEILPGEKLYLIK